MLLPRFSRTMMQSCDLNIIRSISRNRQQFLTMRARSGPFISKFLVEFRFLALQLKPFRPNTTTCSMRTKPSELMVASPMVRMLCCRCCITTYSTILVENLFACTRIIAAGKIKIRASSLTSVKVPRRVHTHQPTQL